MTNEELQSIISAVLSAIRTSSALITDLTEVTTLPGDAYLELSGGRRIKSTTLRSILQTAIMDDAVGPLVANEETQRKKEDVALRALITVLDTTCKELDKNKFNKADVAQSKGTSTTQVMSQNAVNTELTTLKTMLTNIEVSTGSNTNNSLSLGFKDATGRTKSVPIQTASETLAGIMKASDYKMLKDHDTLLLTLDDERITAFSAKATTEVVMVQLARKDEDPYVLTMPIAGTLNDDEEPLAGVMTGKQAQNLADVTEKCFPLELVDEYSDDGVFMPGESIYANIEFRLMKHGVDVSQDCEIYANGLETYIDDDGTVYLTSYNEFNIGHTFNVTIRLGEETIERSYKYEFQYPVYGVEFNEAATDDPKELLTESYNVPFWQEGYELGLTKLPAGYGYIFAIPLNWNMVVRDESGAEITDCERGTVDIPSYDGEGSSHTYYYIIVPASTRGWTFKITNN